MHGVAQSVIIAKVLTVRILIEKGKQCGQDATMKLNAQAETVSAHDRGCDERHSNMRSRENNISKRHTKYTPT
jgi:hypothetical protein